ncbi:HSP20 domain containing protein, partial [Asbolus verrucosus]
MCLEPEDLVPLVPRKFRNFVVVGGCCRSTVGVDEGKFQVNLAVQQFKPGEMSVKVTGDNLITVKGKYEKQDEHGFISRQFTTILERLNQICLLMEWLLPQPQSVLLKNPKFQSPKPVNPQNQLLSTKRKKSTKKSENAKK